MIIFLCVLMVVAFFVTIVEGSENIRKGAQTIFVVLIAAITVLYLAPVVF